MLNIRFVKFNKRQFFLNNTIINRNNLKVSIIYEETNMI